jgi:predicted DNA-binding transcriptional regulator AlpA
MLNITQLMARLTVRKTAVYNLIKIGDLPKPIKIGGSARWPEEEIDAAIETMKARRNEPPPVTRRGRPRKVKT